MGKTKMSINSWIDEQYMEYLYNDIWFSGEKEWSTDLPYNMVESYKNSGK